METLKSHVKTSFEAFEIDTLIENILEAVSGLERKENENVICENLL